MRAAASFRMELNRESRHICVVYALAGVIITVYKAYFAVFGHTVAYNSVAVVLWCNVNSACFNLFCRLVCTSVTVLELFCFCTLWKRKELMTETDTEGRNPEVTKLFELCNNLCVVRRISRSVWKHYAVGIHSLNFIRCCVGGNDCKVTTSLNKLSADVMLCAKIHKHNIEVAVFSVKMLFFFYSSAFNSLCNNIVLNLVKFFLCHIGRIGDFAVQNTVFTHNSCERTGVDSVNAGNSRLF